MQNGTMLQFFHWYYPNDGSLWNKLKNEAQYLANIGITATWLPPAFKASAGGMSVGYDVYDIYDLGEFDQKGSVRTKYGTKRQYLAAIKAAHKAGIQIYADIVVNHMGGADEKELMQAVKVDNEDRTKVISEPYEIESYTKFTFPGRKNKYSSFKWDHTNFTGIDYDDKNKETAIFNIINPTSEGWEKMVNNEKGNYDYLMYADIEFRNPAVREELKKWGKWYKEIAQIDGVRLDAVKHISPLFYNEWLDYMRSFAGKDFFAVGEFWGPRDLASLLHYIDATEEKMSLFDAPLHNTFHIASTSGKDFNMITIFNDSLLSVKPQLAVTVVENHDTQPLQALEAPIDEWFKRLAYALILLREQGYPCIFYPDLYGAEYTDKGSDGNDYNIKLEKVNGLENLISLRKNTAYGTQRDYFDHPNCIGWTREGIAENKNSGCAIIMSNGDEGFKLMEIGKKFAGEKFIDQLGNYTGEVIINKDGFGKFSCKGASVSVWVHSN